MFKSFTKETHEKKYDIKNITSKNIYIIRQLSTLYLKIKTD